MRANCLFVLVIFLWGCTNSQNEKSNNVEWNGALVPEESIKLQPEYSLDSIQFSNGSFKYLLKGTLNVKSKVRDYQILMNSNPFTTKVSEVNTQVFPLELPNSNKYDCKIYSFDNRIAIEWKFQMERLTFFIPRIN